MIGDWWFVICDLVVGVWCLGCVLFAVLMFWCSGLNVCYVLFVECCLLFVVRCVLVVVCCVLGVECWLLLRVRCVVFVVC